jgi:hypothetical protein
VAVHGIVSMSRTIYTGTDFIFSVVPDIRTGTRKVQSYRKQDTCRYSSVRIYIGLTFLGLELLYRPFCPVNLLPLDNIYLPSDFLTPSFLRV